MCNQKRVVPSVGNLIFCTLLLLQVEHNTLSCKRDLVTMSTKSNGNDGHAELCYMRFRTTFFQNYLCFMIIFQKWTKEKPEWVWNAEIKKPLISKVYGSSRLTNRCRTVHKFQTPALSQPPSTLNSHQKWHLPQTSL